MKTKSDLAKTNQVGIEEKGGASAPLFSRFQPDVTPQQAKALGVLEGKYTDGNPRTDNFFKIDASMSAWPDQWHNPQHPLGWFQWWEGYSSGKRTDDDERQIKRWLSFKARHLAQLRKADPTLENLSIQPRRRQALLNWGIAPGIKMDKENKYLEKIASKLAQEEMGLKSPYNNARMIGLQAGGLYAGARIGERMGHSAEAKLKNAGKGGLAGLAAGTAIGVGLAANRAHKNKQILENSGLRMPREGSRAANSLAHEYGVDTRYMKKYASEIRKDKGGYAAPTAVGAAVGAGAGAGLAHTTSREFVQNSIKKKFFQAHMGMSRAQNEKTFGHRSRGPINRQFQDYFRDSAKTVEGHSPSRDAQVRRGFERFQEFKDDAKFVNGAHKAQLKMLRDKALKGTQSLPGSSLSRSLKIGAVGAGVGAIYGAAHQNNKNHQAALNNHLIRQGWKGE